MPDDLRTYTIDEPIKVDGRETTLRKEWGGSNAHLQQLRSGEEVTGWHVIVHREEGAAADFRVSREVYASIESGQAWATKA